MGNVYNNAMQKILNSYLVASSADMRVALVMSNTTADTETDGIEFMDDFATLDESDDSTYARVALASEVVNTDDANNRAEFDANDSSFTGLTGNASRDYVGVVLYKHVTNDTDSVPICFIPFGSTVSAAATQVDIPWDAQGLVQLAAAA